MTDKLQAKIQQLPLSPGVYIYKDAKGVILYVGKAVKLRNRVKSYFRGNHQHTIRIQQMVAKIADLDYVVTDNEVESLILENNFIKQFQPKYNVRLRDDKNYLFLKISLADEIPSVSYERKPADKHARYFGPYTSSVAIKETLRLVRKIFPYCANDKVGAKPCFYYHIGKCPGVCFGKITLPEYRENYISKIIQFLDGRQTEILKDLQHQMKTLSGRKQFEKAAKIRDQIFALNRIQERQKLVYTKRISQDVVSLHNEHVASINLFLIREGKLIQKENFIVDNTKQVPPAEILETFLGQYYLDATNLPREILLPFAINDESLRMAIGNRRLPKVLTASRGDKLKLMQLGAENAKQYLQAQSDKHLLEESRLMSSLKELQRVLDLPRLPARMECFDISNIQGTNAVGSMVVFDFAKPKKDQYRKFKIQSQSTPDDFAMMREMLTRRLKHSLPPADDQPSILPSWPLPDLIIIDGGKGQLSTAVSVLKQFQLPDPSFRIPIIGLAKRLEEIFLPGKSRPIILPQNSIALFLLQRIRDEAHRFAITYHRKLRSKASTKSVLDEVAGIGPATKKKLLQTFGSVGKIRQANLTELSNAVGKALAEKIKAGL